MKIPARCNRRVCQARRNLNKPLNQYVRPPKCHVCGEGLMYVDKYRLRRGPKDVTPKCEDPGCRLIIARHMKRPLMVHRVSNEGCSGYKKYQEDKAMRGPVKNTPFRELVTECPF